VSQGTLFSCIKTHKIHTKVLLTEKNGIQLLLKLEITPKLYIIKLCESMKPCFPSKVYKTSFPPLITTNVKKMLARETPKKLIRFFLLISLLCSGGAGAQDWVMSVQHADLSPFKHRNGFGPGGINVDIMSAITDEIGVNLKFVDYSVAEGREKFKSGDVSVDCCLNEIWFPKQQDIHVFSKPVYRLIEVFVFPKGKMFPIPDTSVLKDKTVAGIRGFTYPGQDNYGTRIDGDNPLEILRLVHEGKVDVAVLERHAASFYINSNKFKVQFGDPYYSVDVSVRLHKSLAARLDDVNRAIDKLKSRRMIQQIITRNIR